MKNNFLLFVCLFALGAVAGNVRDAVFEATPGESWQLDWSWREKKVPLTAMMKPHLTAYDATGRTVYDRDVGKAQQKVYDPKDLNIQKWRVFATILKDGETRKGGTMITISHVFLPATTAKVRMTLVGCGDPAEIEGLEMGVVKRSDPPVQKDHSFPQMSEADVHILTDAELDAHLAERAKAVPKLVAKGDRTELLINGEPVVPRVYKGPTKFNANRLPGVSIFSRKGFNVFTTGFSFADTSDPKARATAGIWRPDGTPDAEKIRASLREHLRRAPDAYFMLCFGVTPYNGWGEKHPSEIFRNEKGQFGVFSRSRVVAFRDTPTLDYSKNEWPAVSYASETFADETAAFVERLFAAIEGMPEGKAVIGVYCCGGTDGQWLDLFDNHVDLGYPQCADYSDVAKRRFAAYRRRKCGRDDVDVRIPTGDELWDRKNQFYGEHAESVASDYREFLAKATTQFRLKVARGIKRGSNGRILVGSYSPAGGLEGFPLISATYTKGLLKSPDYDFFAVVPNYMREHVDPVIAAVYDGSCIARGKLYISELDLRCGEVRNWGFWGSDFWADNHTAATFRRKAIFFAANALTHGGAFHAYDMDGGWFAGEGAQAAWTKANALADHVRPMPPAEERIALVGGERFYDFQSFGKGRVVPYFIREQPRSALSLAGVPWNQYLLEDVLSDEQAELPKVVVFTDLSTVTPEAFAALKKRFAKDGRVLVYTWRPGVFSPEGAKIEASLGLKAEPEAFGKVGFADGTSSDPLMKGVKGMIIPNYPYYGIDYAPVSSPDPAAGWKTLATFRGTEIPALAVRRNQGFTEVHTAFPGGITPELCRNLVREAGLKPLVDSNELSGYGSGLFYIVAQSDGRKRFRLPKGVRPGQVLEGPAFRPDGDGFAVTLKRGDIFVLAVVE